MRRFKNSQFTIVKLFEQKKKKYVQKIMSALFSYDGLTQVTCDQNVAKMLHSVEIGGCPVRKPALLFIDTGRWKKRGSECLPFLAAKYTQQDLEKVEIVCKEKAACKELPSD